MILAIDPGVRGCGVAMFDENAWLVRAMYVRNPTKSFWDMARAVNDVVCSNPFYGEVIVEVPRIYPGAGGQKGDPNDLINLALVDGAIVGILSGSTSEVVRYFPQEWKGQVPKDVMNRRVLGKLSPEELARIEHVGALDHNTYDAIGIGLHHLGRLK